ncbi:hypothetical protein [Rodentibacter caecimuris]|uniref:Gfo/Idh/MocA-like oxidoreductase N-terminal domain-containing protein n=1 Tax=Rodentibacter caecimuris TaxID=1796644 RepID=A0ABX3KZE6_9PAST|nr:hypothetical protein BKG89_01245 [Rodentibacter heylii]
MKLGIVGTGMIVQDLLQTLHLIKLEKLALFGRNIEKTRQLATNYPFLEIGELLWLELIKSLSLVV